MNEHEQTIDLRNLLKILTDHIIAIITFTLLCGVIGVVLSTVVIEKQYTATAMLYVENSSEKSGDSAININDITAAQKLVNTCQILFTSDYMLQNLESQLPEYEYTSEDYANIITIGSVNNTEVLSISVITNSPRKSVVIADKVVDLAQNEFMRVIKNGSIEIVSNAICPSKHTFPSVPIFTAIGLFIGLFGSYFIFFIIDILDTKVKPEDDLAKMYDIPVFAEIMDFLAVDKTVYDYNEYGEHGEKSDSSADYNDY